MAWRLPHELARSIDALPPTPPDDADAAPMRMETRNTARASTCVDCEALRHVTTQRDGISEARGLG